MATRYALLTVIISSQGCHRGVLLVLSMLSAFAVAEAAYAACNAPCRRDVARCMALAGEPTGPPTLGDIQAPITELFVWEGRKLLQLTKHGYLEICATTATGGTTRAAAASLRLS